MTDQRKSWRAALLLGVGFLFGVSAHADEKDGKKAVRLLVKADELKADDGKDTNLTSSPRKVYKIKLAAGKTYQIDLNSGEFDAVLRLEDSAGKEVDFNDDAPGEMTLDARIVYKAAKAGEYSVIATCLDARPGKFKLTVAEIPGADTASKFRGQAGELVWKGGKAHHEGELTDADQTVANRYYKAFTIKLEAGKTYRIDYRGADPNFDAFLFLEDADGNTLAEDDDSGGGLNAQVSHQAGKSGNYRIIATTLPPRQRGKFTLGVVNTDAEEGKEARLRSALILASNVTVEPYRHKLTSVADNVHVGEFEINSKVITPTCPLPWSIRKVRLHGGRQEGSELIILDNGMLQVTLIPTRGMGILSARLGDVRLGWDSPVKEVVHPKFMNLQARGGLGWLDGFNEWMVRCGLENNGQAGKDEFINNMGDKATMDLTLHGKIANLPAQEVEVFVEREAPFRITIRGVVHERMVFGPKLELATAISTVPGTNTFRIHDVVTNRGAQPEEFQMLYHANFGKPLLEEGAKFLAPAERVTPFNANAARDVDRYNQFAGPTPGYIEQVYLFRPLAGADGRTTIALRNRVGDKAASMSYAVKELPYLTLWKNTSAEADGYVTGLEPGTNYPNNRRVERQAGRVPKLAGGGSHAMTLDIAIHANSAQVEEITRRIAAIQGNREPIVDRQPNKQ